MKIARYALWLAACSGTDTGNPPVIDFGNSGCHDQSYRVNKDAHALITPDPRYKGLTCMVFDHEADTLHLTISNYEAGCGTDDGWTPSVAQRASGGLDVILEDRICGGANCGSCLYDLSFTFDASDVSDGEVHIYQRGCSDVRDERVATLSLSQNAGVACAYTQASALIWKGAYDGSERMLCGDVAGQSVACQPGLTCTMLAQDGQRCLKNCSADADCDSLSHCVNNVCQLP